jgi:hypothetical protein
MPENRSNHGTSKNDNGTDRSQPSRRENPQPPMGGVSSQSGLASSRGGEGSQHGAERPHGGHGAQGAPAAPRVPG